MARKITEHTDAHGHRQTAVRDDGRFAEKDARAAAASSSDLFAPEDSWGRARGAAGMTEDQLADRRALWDERLAGHERDKAAMRHLRRTIGAYARKAELDDDQTEAALHDSILEAMKALKSKELKAWKASHGGSEEGFSWTPVALHKMVATDAGLINRCFAPAVQKMRFDPSIYNAQDISARARLEEAESGFRHEHGREMTRAERQAAADAITASYPPGHRPHIGWEDFGSYDNSLDETDDEGNRIYENRFAAPGSEPRRELREGSAGADAVDAAYGERKQDRTVRLTRAQQKGGWNTYADAAQLPLARAERMKPESADRAKRTIGRYPGGVAQIAEDLLYDRIPPRDRQAVEMAFFSPFAKNAMEMPSRDRHLILETMTTHRDRAEMLWGSALEQAS